MKISGFDFTSAPRSAKPITQCLCTLSSSSLNIDCFRDHDSFESFEDELKKAGPWIAGIDFPFGQSRRLIENIGWPQEWKSYAELLNSLTRKEFCNLLNEYKGKRPSGDKEHKRATDRKAGSISPQKLYGVPVGKMFYEGARRLVRTGTNIVPVRGSEENRTIIEAYPALVARKAIGRKGYKSDTKKKQTAEHLNARREIIDYLFTEDFQKNYSLLIRLSHLHCDQLLTDATGDRLDSLLCAIQAAWAWQRRDDGFGVPDMVDQLEGWIVDPEM